MIIEYLKGNKKITKNHFFILLTIVLFIFIVIMRYLDSYLITDLSPAGIVSFELAKDVFLSKAIINSWDETARTAAGISMGLDFIFLIVYSLFIAVLIQKLNNSIWKNNSIYVLGKILVVAILIAAIFDAIENVALIKLLLGDVNEIWSSTAFYFASLKFILILCCIIYIIINAMILLIKRIKVPYSSR